MEKGTRVRIVSGREGKDVCGSIFWTGPDKFDGGLRLGIRGEDGQTYWTNQANVEVAAGAAPPVEAGPTFNKGDRVAFTAGSREGTGSVFWIGASRSGPGQRLGINDDDGEEAVWLDARFARALDASASPPPARGGNDHRYDDDGGDDDGYTEAPAPNLDAPPPEDAPPPDDDWLESAAGGVDGDEPPQDW